MTNERAIEILYGMKEGLKISLQDKYADDDEKEWAKDTNAAYTMAIQALERGIG